MAEPCGCLVACVDFGSTFTKAALSTSDRRPGRPAEHRTTIDTDVLDGWDACRAVLAAADRGAADAEVLACSPAGGGLRIGVVGNEELVTAEAGRRVALSSGGRVVHVASGGLTATVCRSSRKTGPTSCCCVGGTDGGNAEVLLACADDAGEGQLARPGRCRGQRRRPREVARDARRRPARRMCWPTTSSRRSACSRRTSARAAIREMFLRHVIGGKHLSSARRRLQRAMVRGATPDVVLTAVELLAHGLDAEHPGAGDVVVVDVGGATTDVHSVVELDPEDAGLGREVVATLPVSRTVEGDLGMRWSAVPTVEEGVAAGLLDDAERAAVPPRRVRRADPAFLPDARGEPSRRRGDRRRGGRRSRCAGTRAGSRSCLRPGGRVVERSGKDLREVDLLVGSGGVLRNNAADVAARVLGAGHRRRRDRRLAAAASPADRRRPRLRAGPGRAAGRRAPAGGARPARTSALTAPWGAA